jgi:hypothetical protein
VLQQIRPDDSRAIPDKENFPSAQFFSEFLPGLSVSARDYFSASR